MAKVEIYSTARCPYCDMAKRLLEARNQPYIEYRIDSDSEKRAQMQQRKPGARTVPQIFIDDQSIGGYDELYALQKSGELDTLLDK